MCASRATSAAGAWPSSNSPVVVGRAGGHPNWSLLNADWQEPAYGMNRHGSSPILQSTI
jgi:hypothetical protein